MAEPTPGTSPDPTSDPVPAVDWSDLPEAVRSRLADLTAQAVGHLPDTDLPTGVRPVARFAPAKRARLGGSVLLAALGESRAFRTAVVQWARTHREEWLDPSVQDRPAAAAAAILLGDAAATDLVEQVHRRADDSRMRAERDGAVARARRAEAEAKALRDELERSRSDAEQPPEDTVERLRGRLREQGVRLRQALDEVERARAGHDEQLSALRRDLAAMTLDRDRATERATAEATRSARIASEARDARQAAREARDADEIRLALLLDTVTGAAAGLRRELGLVTRDPSGARPADLVAGASEATRWPAASARPVDVAELDRLLTLPSVHVVVDGYNVTKSGYPELTLADQRDRLVRQLAALAARTGVEMTLVFDGAAVTAVPTVMPRSVRVLFSDPGISADDVIRDLVAIEPAGRAMVVVTSDRAVADSVRRLGAHPVPSLVLLERLRRV